MAIRILLDHGVKEDRIIFVTFLVARQGGISVLKRAFPGVKVVCGAVDNEMEEGWLEGYKGEGNPEGKGRNVWVMKPGMGQIGAFILTTTLIEFTDLQFWYRRPILSVIYLLIYVYATTSVSSVFHDI